MVFWIPKTKVKFESVEPHEGRLDDIRFISCVAKDWRIVIQYDISFELFKQFELCEEGCIIPEGFYKGKIVETKKYEEDDTLEFVRIKLLEHSDPPEEVTVIKDREILTLKAGEYSVKHAIAFYGGKVIASLLQGEFVEALMKELKNSNLTESVVLEKC